MEVEAVFRFCCLSGKKSFGKIRGWGRVLGWKVSNDFEKKTQAFIPSELSSEVCRCLWGKKICAADLRYSKEFLHFSKCDKENLSRVAFPWVGGSSGAGSTQRRTSEALATPTLGFCFYACLFSSVYTDVWASGRGLGGGK